MKMATVSLWDSQKEIAVLIVEATAGIYHKLKRLRDKYKQSDDEHNVQGFIKYLKEHGVKVMKSKAIDLVF